MEAGTRSTTLVDNWLLIPRNSGDGKSWLLRLIAERAGSRTIVPDNEGEFASLREAVGVLLVGAGGALAANPRHAALRAAATGAEFRAGHNLFVSGPA